MKIFVDKHVIKTQQQTGFDAGRGRSGDELVPCPRSSVIDYGNSTFNFSGISF